MGQDDEETQDSQPKSVLETHGYTLNKTIGHGSYATVKEAYSQSHNCKVAIKVVSKRRSPRDYLEKFLPREVSVIKMLRHPNLVLFLQSIETNQRVYIILEFAPHGDLLDAVRSRGTVDEPQAGIWFSELTHAIDYCHSKGVVHRDLKCENLLLDDTDHLKVTDFGFARNGMKPLHGQFPLSQTYCGSYAYASPEILSGTPYVPQLADIWSMGVILYVMVLGKLPFDDSNHRKLLEEVRHGPNFPHNRPASMECKLLIKKILTNLEIRASIPQIREDYWFRHYAVEPPPSPQFGSSNVRMILKGEKPVEAAHTSSSPKGHLSVSTKHMKVWSDKSTSKVVGKLPFDDSNHRKLLKAVRNGPIFPKSRPVTEDCKQLMIKMLQPLKTRIAISSIYQDGWYKRITAGIECAKSQDDSTTVEIDDVIIEDAMPGLAPNQCSIIRSHASTKSSGTTMISPDC